MQILITNKTALKLSFIIASLLALNACSALPEPRSKPDRRYYISEGKPRIDENISEIIYRARGVTNDFFYPNVDKLKAKNKILVDFLAPAGKWDVSDDYSDIKNNGSVSFTTNANSSTAYGASITLYRLKKPSLDSENYIKLSWERYSKMLAGDYQAEVDYQLGTYDEKRRQALKNSYGNRKLYSKVTQVNKLICVEFGWGSQAEEAQDIDQQNTHSKNEWSGRPFYDQDVTIYCPLRRDDQIWWLRVLFNSITADFGYGGYSPKDYESRTAREIYNDLRQRMQRTLDSIEVYGFSQTPMPENKTAEPTE